MALCRSFTLVKSFVLTTLLLCGIARVCAQAAAGPTMEETIGFVESSLQKQGDIRFSLKTAPVDFTTIHDQHVRLVGPCAVEVTSVQTDNRNDVRSRLQIDLAKSDPMSVGVSRDGEDLIFQELYNLTIKRAIWKWLEPLPNPNATMPPPEKIMGIVRAVNGNDLMLMDQTGILLTIAAGKNVSWQGIQPGMRVGIVAENKKGGLRANFVVPTPFGNGIRPEPVALQFNDKDLADRNAKALIHALVLCHKDEAPSPF